MRLGGLGSCEFIFCAHPFRAVASTEDYLVNMSAQSSVVVWTTQDLAGVIGALPREGRLPACTVILPRMRIAHALRRALIQERKSELLIGTTFTTPSAVAGELLSRAGIELCPAEAVLRPMRLRQVLQAPPKLEHFDAELFRSTRGWDDAVSSTLDDLESAGLTANDLLKSANARCRDVARLWMALEAAAPNRLTLAGALKTARGLLGREDSWPFAGPTLALINGHESAVQAALLCAIPGVQLALLGARPPRRLWLKRLEALYGEALAEAAVATAPTPAIATAKKTATAATIATSTATATANNAATATATATSTATVATTPTGLTAADHSERAVLAANLFASPEALGSPTRSRSAGPDGTVSLEEYSGIEAELEAAADWVGRCILGGTRLDDIAVLVPHNDPLVSRLRERLQRLPWDKGCLPVFVAGGEAATATAVGTYLLAVTRALQESLPATLMVEVLTSLQLVPGDGRQTAPGYGRETSPRNGRQIPPGYGRETSPRYGRETSSGNALQTSRRNGRETLSHSDATHLVSSLGTLGGSVDRPEEGLVWARRAVELAAALRERISQLEAAELEGRDDAEVRTLFVKRRLLDCLSAVQPALEAMVAVLALVQQDAPLAEAWEALRDFFAQWIRCPSSSEAVRASLEGAMRPMVEDEQKRLAQTGAAASGLELLELVERVLRSLRHSVGRFGEPRVYVGTVSGAVGLQFEAVRIIGLSEGSIPPSLRDDPVLDELTRAELTRAELTRAELTRAEPTGAEPTGAELTGAELTRAELMVPTFSTLDDRALLPLHALHQVVLNTTGSVALSCPRTDLARTSREPSSVFIEAAAALARPNRTTQAKAEAVPSLATIARDYFAVGSEILAKARGEAPIGQFGWLHRVAIKRGELHPAWLESKALDLERGRKILEDRGGALDGILGDGAGDVPMRGLVRELPISPSRLKTLFECPHRYLLESVLGWGAPAAAQPTSEIDAATYGTLVHRVMERFSRDHAEGFAGRKPGFATWEKKALGIGEEEFSETIKSYALLSQQMVDLQRSRMQRDVRLLLKNEWEAKPARTVVATERSFGAKDGLGLKVGEKTIYVRGFIDRVERQGTHTVVRDFKTGRPHPKQGAEEGPVAVLDTQIALYGMVARKLAANWELPKNVAGAYVYPNAHSPERAFLEDFPALETAAKGWFEFAVKLLEARVFPRSADSNSCKYSPFILMCGKKATTDSLERLQQSDGLERELLGVQGLGSLTKDEEGE
jgi:RecB family exonuclease